MNKSQLIRRVRDMYGDRLTAEEAVEAVFDCVVREVAEGERVSVTGFGSLEQVHIDEHEGHNPATGGRVTIRARRRVRFRAGQNFTALVNGDKLLPLGSAIKKAPKGTAFKR